MKRYIKCARKLNQDNAFSFDPAIRRNYAKRIADPNILSYYVYDPDETVREAVASNPHLPPEYMKDLIHDEYSPVRAELAKNPAAPADVLMPLVDDPNEHIRFCLAHNWSASPAVLAKLANSGSGLVLWNLAYNPNTPADTLHSFLSNDRKLPRHYATHIRTEARKNLRRRGEQI